jgi:hypothetical protein
MEYRITRHDFRHAIFVQSACNLSGVVHSFHETMNRIWDEAIANGKGTDWVNKHPICRLYAEQIAHLSGAGVPHDYESWEEATNECEREAVNEDRSD